MRPLALLPIVLLASGCITLRPPSLGLGEIFANERWEYHHEVFCDDPGAIPEATAAARTAVLNRLGRDRWELVQMETREVGGAAARRCTLVTLKRRAD